jgi:hypothetical protein
MLEGGRAGARNDKKLDDSWSFGPNRYRLAVFCIPPKSTHA